MFDHDKPDILAAAKCTSFIFIEEGPADRNATPPRFYGSAFFVSPTRLLTAGHNVVGVNRPVVRILITAPGIDKVEPWQVTRGKIATIKCELVGTIYKRGGLYTTDIAVLDSGTFSSADYLSLSSTIPPSTATVDVIGYPGLIKPEWIWGHEGVADPGKGLKVANILLPTGHLTVSRGVVDSTQTAGSAISYELSTCPGMSGSCVLYKGKVIGTYLLYTELI
jgi:V8-like Glu-specific endopeptidase